jgi:hypothetical protein
MVQKPPVILAVVVAAILTLSSVSQTFAQAKKPTSLSISPPYPCCELKTSKPTVPITFYGKLYTEGSEGPGGATIHLIGTGTGFWFGETNKFGSYLVTVDLGPGTYHVHTHYGGDSDHESSDSGTISYRITH